LDLLESRQIRATFFVIGMNAERYPALIQSHRRLQPGCSLRKCDGRMPC
jgi:hypothetical protein